MINADTLGHGLYDINQPGYEAVLNAFGSSILTSDHKVDRQKLGAIVFTNKVMIVTIVLDYEQLSFHTCSMCCLFLF